MKKETGTGLAIVLVGCGVAIGAMAAKIHYDRNRIYYEELRRLKKESDFKFSKEFKEELKEELRKEREEEVEADKVKNKKRRTRVVEECDDEDFIYC